MKPVTKPITGRLASRSFQLSTQAQMIAKPGLRNSDGCKLIPTLIQRRAPFFSSPMTGTTNKSASMIAPKASRL